MSNPNPSPSNRFKKGDPRINRKGRPKSFDALRALAQQVAHEEALSGGQPVIVNGRIATVAEMIIRQWAASKNPQLQARFIEIAFGKVPDNLYINTKGPIVEIGVKAIDYRAGLATLAPGPIPDSHASSAGESSRNGSKMG